MTPIDEYNNVFIGVTMKLALCLILFLTSCSLNSNAMTAYSSWNAIIDARTDNYAELLEFRYRIIDVNEDRIKYAYEFRNKNTHHVSFTLKLPKDPETFTHHIINLSSNNGYNSLIINTRILLDQFNNHLKVDNIRFRQSNSIQRGFAKRQRISIRN